MGFSRSKWVAAAIAAAMVSCGGAEAKNRALLIGAADYTDNLQLRDLNGPRNDVTAMWRYLKASGYAEEDIVVLTDSLPETPDFPKMAGLATYDNITAELDRLASFDYAPGETVVFYYAGHGTTVPDRNPAHEVEPEANGRDQAFLPTDTGPAVDGGTWENVLVDDELGEKLTAVRARGVDVWAIFDACNSGGGTRGGEEARYADPSALGFTDELPEPSETRGAEREGALSVAPTSAGMGRLIGFYAVDSFNLAYEKHFEFADYQQPVFGADSKTQRMGIFSNYLNRALITGSAQTYEQLFQEIVAGIAADPGSTNRPRPMADGALSLTLPGRDGSARLKGLLEDGALRIPAGTFQGFDVQAGITVYDPGSPDVAIATGVISSATAANSLVTRLYWLDPQKKTETSAMPMPVRVTEPVTKFEFSIGTPDNLDGLPAADRGRIETIFASAFAKNAQAFDIGVDVTPAGTPDLNVTTRVEDGRLWLIQPGSLLVKDTDAFDQTQAIDLSGQNDSIIDALRTAAWQLGRAEKLVRTATTHATDSRSDLVFQGALYREGEVSRDARQTCPDRGMKPLDEQERARLKPLSAGAGPVAAGNCDILRLGIKNTSRSDAYFIGAFYVDARGGIFALDQSSGRPSEGNCVYSLPRRQDQEMVFETQVFTWMGDGSGGGQPGPTGLERIIVLAVKADETGLPPNLCQLSQPSLDATITTRSAATRGGTSDLDALIGDVAGTTRAGGGSMKYTAPSKVSMEAFMLELNVAP